MVVVEERVKVVAVEVEVEVDNSTFSSFFLFRLCFLSPSLSVSLSFASSSQAGSVARSLPTIAMVGLPWPLSRGRRKQQQATLATIPTPVSPSTASPAVSAVHAAPGHLPVRVDPQTSQQVWQGWGTSLCWWANVVGEERNEMKD